MGKKFVVEVTPQDCGWVFGEYGEVTSDDSLLFKRPQDVALVVFTGGHDVWPDLYGEKPGKYTHYSKERDHYEGVRFDQALKFKIPMVGICRGSQFLCVKSGGKLAQHIENHAGPWHTIQMAEEFAGHNTIMVNSSHHQMQLPPKNAVPLAWSETRQSPLYLNGNDKPFEVDMEYEVVHYPSTNAIGIQFHPEWLNAQHPCVKVSQEIVRNYLFKG